MLRYSSVLRSNAVRHREISYNQLTPKPVRGKKDSLKPQRLRLGFEQTMALLMPYSGVRVLEQMKAVIPLALYLVLFQLIILRQPVEAALLLVGGLTAVIVGLALFMEGLNVGLMPFGTLIGDKLPRKASMPVMLAIIAILGVGVTFAEPAIGALQAFGASVDVTRAPSSASPPPRVMTDARRAIDRSVGPARRHVRRIPVAALARTRTAIDWGPRARARRATRPRRCISRYGKRWYVLRITVS